MTVAGFTSTGSKRPDLLFGAGAFDVPQAVSRANGCTVTATDGHEYLDFIMGLGAVALGYGDPQVNDSVIDAVRRGTVGALAPEEESLLAAELHGVMPWMEQVRFLKTGAEAVAAAVRIARVATDRELVLGCGYHGWLDWCSDANGVPASTRQQYTTLPFNNVELTRDAIRAGGDHLACVVVEPVIDALPSIDWLNTLRDETARVGALLIFDEIKTAFRIALGGATELWGVTPDLTVLGKALANGYPLAVVGGRRGVMRATERTWISSTMSTEFVSLAAARATLGVMKEKSVPAHLQRVGNRLFAGLGRLADDHAALNMQVRGIPQMCYLQFGSEAMSHRLAIACAHRRLLFKRTAYNFISLAHENQEVDQALEVLGEALAAC